MRHNSKSIVLSFLIPALFAFCKEENSSPPIQSENNAIVYLKKIMDQFHQTLNVYTDLDTAGNHFVAKANMNGAPLMDEGFSENPQSGLTCIKASYSAGKAWGGWYFMNGTLQGSQSVPQPNWGNVANAGYDVGETEKLTFWARGEEGGEKVEFFIAGVGRDPASGDPINSYPDSSPKISTGYVTLSKEWIEYSINTKGKDLSYVLGGFGWVSSDTENQWQDITFFIDEIKYLVSKRNEPRLLVSYQVEKSSNDFDRVLRNVSFIYDDALALMAFLSEEQYEYAELLADALVYIVYHDRYYEEGRIRNGVAGGDLKIFPGWLPNGRANTYRMPGWTENGQWLEDEFNVSVHTGNAAWLMLALLAYHQVTGITGQSSYLQAAMLVGDWVEDNCKDIRGEGGYTGGFEGWEPNPSKLLYKATEHQIDLWAAFQRLYLITNDIKWKNRADHAKALVVAMYDTTGGKFLTGTTEDGVTINNSVIPVDIQAWAILALKDDYQNFLPALVYADNNIKVGGGYAFSQSDLSAAWLEGTAQMAAAYYFLGEDAKAQEIIGFIESNQDSSGGIYATSSGELRTGFNWTYFHRRHVGATAWYVLAKNRVNPFWMGSQ